MSLQQGKGGRAQAAGRGSRQPSATAEAAAPPASRSKSAEMFAHLPQPRGVTLQSCASQRGPPGEVVDRLVASREDGAVGRLLLSQLLQLL